MDQNPTIKAEVNTISKIPGMGELTAVIILAETNGFELIRSKKQLTSYAGMDIKEKQSGTSVKGNRHIRKSLHLPSLSAVKSNPIHKELYSRLLGRHGIKIKALVAVQRKMLELSYILWKKTQYNADYEQEKRTVIITNSLGN